MSSEESSQVYRVTIRGRFDDLSDAARRYLVGNQAEHDIFVSAYTPDGTLTYDDTIDFFNLRYEMRRSGDHPSQAAADAALAEAELFLRTMRFGYRDLKVSVVDMSTMWNKAKERLT